MQFDPNAQLSEYFREQPQYFVRRPRRPLLDYTGIRVVVKILTYVSTFIFAVVSLGFFTFTGSLIQRKKIKRLEPSAAVPSEKKFVWVDPLIQKTDKDLDEIKGEYLKSRRELPRDANGKIMIKDAQGKRTQPKDVGETPAAKVLLDKKTMGSLLEAVFDWAFDDLKGTQKHGVVFNDSAAIVHPEYRGNVEAFYHWMVFFLIQHGGIAGECGGAFKKLVLNLYLKISPSEACHVLSADAKGNHTFYQFEDEWTPSKDSGVTEGIDPLTLKWIVERLKTDPIAFSTFETLLLEALIPSNDPELKKAHQFISEKTEAAALVKKGLFLVHDMALVLKTNFAEIMERKWKAKAVNRNVSPAPGKQVKFESYQTKIPWTLNPVRPSRMGQMVLKVIAFVGYLLGNLLTLGLLSFGVTVYQHGKLDRLEAENGSNPPREPELKKDLWIKPSYKKCAEDPEYVPVDIRKINAIVSPQNIAQVRTMDTLISSSFDHTFHQLLKMSKDKVWKLHFNKSSKLFKELMKVAGNDVRKYQENMLAVYNLMVFELIEAGGLIREANQYRVTFNDHLSVGYSRPCRVPSREGSSEATFFLHQDAWTPKVESGDALNGVDPVGVKWMIEQLKNDKTALNNLKILLLHGLIPDDSEDLRLAKYYTIDGKMGELVKSAYEQISAITLAISENFLATLSNRWDVLADDDSCEPLENKGTFVIDPDGVETEWMPPDYLPMDGLLEETMKTKSLIHPFWTHIDQLALRNSERRVDQVLPTNVPQALQLLESQYYWIHAGIGHHGCLMSALTAHVYQGSESGNQENQNFNPAVLKAAMAVYLDQNSDDFRAEIDQSTLSRGLPGWTVDEYKNWLLTGQNPSGKKARANLDMGDLEMELFARTFNIRLSVFEMGKSYQVVDGRMVPGRSYGPNTTEKMVLLNSPGFTFYALMPKCRSPRESDSEEIKQSLEHVQDFWRANNRTEYGSAIRALPRAQPPARR